MKSDFCRRIRKESSSMCSFLIGHPCPFYSRKVRLNSNILNGKGDLNHQSQNQIAIVNGQYSSSIFPRLSSSTVGCDTWLLPCSSLFLIPKTILDKLLKGLFLVLLAITLKTVSLRQIVPL